jgi:hypothetical protein
MLNLFGWDIRLNKLNEIAIIQLKSLTKHHGMKKLAGKAPT